MVCCGGLNPVRSRIRIQKVSYVARTKSVVVVQEYISTFGGCQLHMCKLLHPSRPRSVNKPLFLLHVVRFCVLRYKFKTKFSVMSSPHLNSKLTCGCICVSMCVFVCLYVCMFVACFNSSISIILVELS